METEIKKETKIEERIPSKATTVKVAQIKTATVKNENEVKIS